MTTTAELAPIRLCVGIHASPQGGLSLAEAVAYAAGEPHSEQPACLSPVLAGFGQSVNDVLLSERRQQLLALVPDMIGTAGDGHDPQRALLALDWAVREWTPGWLALARFHSAAGRLAALDPIRDSAAAAATLPLVQEVLAAVHEDAAEAALISPREWAPVWAYGGPAVEHLGETMTKLWRRAYATTLFTAPRERFCEQPPARDCQCLGGVQAIQQGRGDFGDLLDPLHERAAQGVDRDVPGREVDGQLASKEGNRYDRAPTMNARRGRLRCAIPSGTPRVRR